MARAIRSLLVPLALVAASGCGGSGQAPHEHADFPAPPPRGWRTVRNVEAGFTLSIPRRWTARVKRTATVIRSTDKLLVLTVAADRGPDGRELSPGDYARRTMDDLPGFEGSVLPHANRVRGSPYRSARVDGAGTLRTTKRPERIMVAAFHRPGRVTFTVVAFSNSKVPARFFGPKLREILRSLRGQPPGQAQRSGRSG